ncbi:Elongator subunit elp2 [Lunasporangiospora selenospora]|uniref:Elongator complex protein 2 n=1 Tax=Lunasporangiospora selenospora TaxID=979761 RepID=A0A9P6KFL6_9FUNG|nr:Elongator subunit elp2 [Lunasporangiospora selenospora]
MTLIIFEDIVSGDELFSDAFDPVEIDGRYEINCTMIQHKKGADVDTGANASAEEAGEDLEDGVEIVNNVVLSNRLQQTTFDKKGYQLYMKDHIKKLKEHYKQDGEDAVKALETEMMPEIKRILANFKDYEFYTGETMNIEGSLMYLNYREDGSTPFFTVFKKALKSRKVCLLKHSKRVQMQATQEFISVGCNRLTQALAWGADGLAAFGAYHAVALYYPMDPARQGVQATLQGHTNRVNCVAFINRGHELDQRNVAIISGSADKTIRVWKRHTPAGSRDEQGSWVCSAVLEAHSGSVTTIGVVRARSIGGEKDLFATGSGDGTIRIWERKEVDALKDEVTCIQEIQVGKKYAQAIAISYFPGTSSPVMAVGSTDNRVGIYVMNSSQFVKSLSLQGHDNWVRSLDFATYTKGNNESGQSAGSTTKSDLHTLHEGDLLLASGSQDKYIRIWRISPVASMESSADMTVTSGSEGGLTQDMLQSLEEMSRSGTQLSTKAHLVEVSVDSTELVRFSVMFEALLLGHDDWVYTVNWQPARMVDGKYHQPMELLSSSTDKSMMIWKPDTATGVWVNNTQVGEIGGNTIGFYGGLFGPDGRWILAYGYNGAFHIWKNEGNETTDRWVPQVPASGHYSSVQSLTWDPSQSYLVSVSLDQTARLFAPWRHHELGTNKLVSTWHEIARPQIHGYDAQCIAFSDKWTFVSGSDEKVLRVFDAPQTFVRSLAKLTGDESVLADEGSRPVGANLPALGLSNKAVYEGDISSMLEAQESEEYLSQQSFVSTGATPTSLVETMVQPPFEEHLLQHTLWPEVEKLFGHGYELMCVDASHDGAWVASACRAHTPDQAVVRLYNTKTWKQTPTPLVSHTLTVTKVLFSHNDKYLLSISRDRLWSLFERVEDPEAADPYRLVMSNKAHARILWDCSWNFDDSMFGTASRDKTIKIWSKSAKEGTAPWVSIATIKLPEAVTAVEFAPQLVNDTQGRHVLAAGLEDGRIFLFTCLAASPETWTPLGEIPRHMTHVGTANALSWRNVKDQERLQLASGGVDHSVRLYNISLS